MAKKTIKDRNNKAIAPATRSDMVFRRDRKSIDEVMLVTDPQELTPEQRDQTQTNIGVKSTVDVVGAGEVQDIPLDIAQENALINLQGEIKTSAYYFISKPYKVKRGDLIFGQMRGSANVSFISFSDSKGNYIKNLYSNPTLTGTESFTLKYYVKNDGFIIFSGTTSLFSLKLIPCGLAAFLLEPAGGYSRDYLINVGLTYKEATDDYSLNGVDGISYNEACRIANIRLFGSDFTGALAQAKIRTNLMPLNIYNSTLNLDHFCYYNTTIEVLYLTRGNVIVTNLAAAFTSATKLRQIIVGILEFSSIDKTSKLATAFDNTPLFEGVNIRGLKISMSIKNSPLWQYTYLKFMIDNAANTSAITITVHPTTYAYLTGTSEPIPEVGGTTEEWQALVTTAQEKQISFAQA